MSNKQKICASCRQPIKDTFVMALGRCWHKEHFLCTHCKNPLKDGKYIEENGQPYCEADWKALFQHHTLPKCAQCNQPIKDTVLNALGQTWHKEHFVCAHCKQPFKGSKFYTENGLPYCEADHKQLFRGKTSGGQPSGAQTSGGQTSGGQTSGGASGGDPICAHCNKPIKDTVLTALGKNWHKDHLMCAHCSKPIQESTFNTNDGKPYCEKDYNALFGKKCSGCNQLIQGTVLTALDKNWHKQCFTCSKCKKPINSQQGFSETGGQPFCLACVV